MPSINVALSKEAESNLEFIHKQNRHWSVSMDDAHHTDDNIIRSTVSHRFLMASALDRPSVWYKSQHCSERGVVVHLNQGHGHAVRCRGVHRCGSLAVEDRAFVAHRWHCRHLHDSPRHMVSGGLDTDFDGCVVLNICAVVEEKRSKDERQSGIG